MFGCVMALLPWCFGVLFKSSLFFPSATLNIKSIFLLEYALILNKGREKKCLELFCKGNLLFCTDHLISFIFNLDINL